MKGASRKSPVNRLAPVPSVRRTCKPQISETNCCCGSRSANLPQTRSSESAILLDSTGSFAPTGPDCVQADVILQPKSLKPPSPSGLNHPFGGFMPGPCSHWKFCWNVEFRKCSGSLLTVETLA